MRHRPFLVRGVGAGLTLLVCALFLLVELHRDRVEWRFVGAATDLPEVYRVLADRHDRGAVVELPFRQEIHGETMRLYRQSFHHHPLVNGYSGSWPQDYLELRGQCPGYLPNRQCLRRLKDIGVDYVVSEPEAMHRQVRAELARFGRRDDVETLFQGWRWLFRLVDGT